MRRFYNLFIIIGLLLLQYCTAGLKGGSRGVASSASSGGLSPNGGGGGSFAVKVDWTNHRSYKNIACKVMSNASCSTAQQVTFEESPGGDFNGWYKFCFDNNNAGGCRKHSATVRNTVLNNPTVMRGVVLYFWKDSTSSVKTTVSLSDVTLRTHLLRIGTDTGAMSLSSERYYAYSPSDPTYRNQAAPASAYGKCVANNSGNYVNIMPAGSDIAPFTSIDIIDEATLATSSAGSQYYKDIYLTSGVGIFSGMVPKNLNDGTLRYSYVPSDKPELVNFGFYEEGAAVTAMANGNLFGLVLSSKGIGTIATASISELTTAITQEPDRVITGICISGTKTVGNSVRPLIFRMSVNTWKPGLKKI